MGSRRAGRESISGYSISQYSAAQFENKFRIATIRTVKALQALADCEFGWNF
jgi:hypothetical protein